MSLFEKLKNKRSSLQEKKDDGIKKPTKKANKEVFDVTGKSAARDAKKYSSGEYPKIGGGSRIGSKSKGPGAETGAKVNLNPTSGSKSKGTTPVKVNITKPVKQSEISKQAKQFTKKINKKNINRPEGIIGDTYVSTDKKGNIRSAKKVNPTLKKSVSQVKGDIEFKQGIQKVRKFSGQKGTGELSDKAPQKVRKFVKDTRAQKIKDLKLPDTSFGAKTKFSQKGFEKTIKKFTKGPKTGVVDPFKGREITKGQANVKGLEAKAFKKTQPKDVKLPKSFTDFSKKLKTLKTDVAKTSSSTPRTVTKKYKPTTTVKQSEVSKQAKDFTTKVNQARTKKVTPTTTASAPKTPNVFKRVTAATSGKKVTNSKGTGNQFRGQENKAAKDARIKADRAASGMGGGKPPKPPTAKGGTLGFFEPGDTPKPKRVVTKQTRALQSAQGKFAKSALGKGVKKNLPQVYKGLRSLGPGGRTLVKKGGLPAVVGLGLLSSPTVRKGIKYALAGGTIGAFAGNKNKKAVLGPKTTGTPKKFNLSPDVKSNPNKSKYTAGVYGRPKAYS